MAANAPPGLITVTSYSLRELAGFFRHLAAACELFESSGTLPPSLFAAAPAASAPAAFTTAGLQPQPRPPLRPSPRPSPQPQAPASAAFSLPPVSAPRPRKKRKQPGDGGRRRPPTGYNLFVRAKLESLKRDGTYAQFADSKAAFKAAVEDWRGLPEEQKRMYTQQASQLAEAAQVPESPTQGQTLEVRESLEASVGNSPPSGSTERGPEQRSDPPQGSAMPGLAFYDPQQQQLLLQQQQQQLQAMALPGVPPGQALTPGQLFFTGQPMPPPGQHPGLLPVPGQPGAPPPPYSFSPGPHFPPH